MRTPHLRLFDPRDAERCCQIITNAAFQMTGLNEEALQFILSKNEPEERAKEFSQFFTLVWEDQGKIRGLGSLNKNEIKRIYVEPSSQRRGIGSSIVRALEQEAQRNHVSCLVVESQPNAVPFYQQLGFQQSKEEGITIGDARFHIVFMEKSL